MINDEKLRNNEKGLELAYAKVLENKYIPHKDLVNDNKFLEEFIFNNEKIKEKIINEYVSSVQSAQSPIKLSTSGYNRGVAHNINIGSLEEAKKYVENMFKF